MINEKANILDAWILIEQLSEGDIKLNDKKLRTIQENNLDFKKIFLQILKKKQPEMLEADFKKSGIVFYFDIFDFAEVITILRDKFCIAIPTSYEEVSKSCKFTFALYFDSQLKFQAEKFFRSISGYVRYKKEIPSDFNKVETYAREKINDRFEHDDFNKVISWLLKVYDVSVDKCRYSFLKNIENDAVNLHSFFITDLQKAKRLSNKNLERYFDGFFGVRQNLDSQNNKENFSKSIFENILQPKFYPLGRFPTNFKYKLSFMQQVAVNLALNDSNNIRSVNGPPGTGKTTLLKDIFADLAVQQAYAVAILQDKKLKGSIRAYKKTTLAIIPEEISNKNIVVASSNNGAVQNIVKELPRLKDIDKQFQDISYFGELCAEAKDEENSKGVQEYWGLFSLEGGKSTNINKLLANLTKINKYLSNDYEDNNRIYEQFIKKYNELKNKVDSIQKYSNLLNKLEKIKLEFKENSNRFELNMGKKASHLNQTKENIEKVISQNLKQQDLVTQSISNISQKLVTLISSSSQVQKKYDLIHEQKPKFLTIQKVFKTANFHKYQSDISEITAKLSELDQKINNEKNSEENLKIELKNLEKIQLNKSNELNDKIREYDEWIAANKKKLDNSKDKIEILEEEVNQCQVEGINTKLSYEEFQKSNPWFSDDFRSKQSELFLLSLKVKEQFLYENRQHLNSAKNAWNKQDENITKEYGQRLLTESWQWINFAIPVISTTFASFSRMFRHLDENTISNLFIDEAGQAIPQASVGAIFRSQKVMVVGDPSQIKPVLTLDSTMLSLVARYYKVDETFISEGASVQSLVDRTSQYGYQKTESEWIGVPLWVHRRCKDPMFSVSNKISYNNLMVQGNEEGIIGKAKWIDCSGKADDKFVQEQAEWLKKEIRRRKDNNPDLLDEIYVITPFSNVAYNLAKELDKIGFTKRDKESYKPINVGTVHVFQGKEAKIVYFVLGADDSSKGAANWVVKDANMMNVAVTRAKEEFYIIGDKSLYKNLNNSIIDSTIDIIDSSNPNC